MVLYSYYYGLFVIILDCSLCNGVLQEEGCIISRMLLCSQVMLKHLQLGE